MGQKARPRATTLNRAPLSWFACKPLSGSGWQRCLAESLAASAGHTRAHDAAHHEAAWDVFQLFGDILAKLAQIAAAV